ncbi:MAG: hypothetical protein R2941_12870 [Desulfobacterales bacterium]
MFEIRANASKNYLYIFLDGYLSDEEVRKAIAPAKQEAEKLSPGFTIINNIIKYKPASPKSPEAIARTQKYLHEKGAGRVIRITGENSLGLHQWRRGQIAGGAGFDVIEVESVEEAKKLAWGQGKK